MKLPGLIDVHVHVREPGATYKEDWETCTSAALAGGITGVLAMPNTSPPVTDEYSFNIAINAADEKARCDYAQYIGATNKNHEKILTLRDKAAGLKMYLNQTYGELKIDNMLMWIKHLKAWNSPYPIVAHAERQTTAAIILLAHLHKRRIHICHVSRKEEILIIKKAKESGMNVTCEVTPHHLFLSDEDVTRIGFGRSEVRPILASKEDQKALWDNLNVIDCFATDHAPHTLQEKDSENPPPGFPGLETALPLLLTAMAEGRITKEDIIQKYYEKPRTIFSLPKQSETWIEIDEYETYTINSVEFLSKSRWSPFDGMNVKGRVRKVVIRGMVAYENRKVLARKGSGENFRTKQ